MHRMTEGQLVFVRCGIPARVVKPAESLAGTRALVEFQDGSREWTITPHIFATEREARADAARQECSELASKVRVMEQELWSLVRKLEAARAVAYPEAPAAKGEGGDAATLDSKGTSDG